MKQGKGSGGQGPIVNKKDGESEAKRHMRGDVEGVNVETGWNSKTKYTGDHDKA